ncbi:MAG: DNA phosphorothioation system sulfurtransferase DndC [Proteobacteria bacterium]|nr:DNA phosphorothioation system sulfurtransferase DndC [Pseudomonadota bacterium]
MTENKKSFFNELGLKATIEKQINLITKLYLEDENPWIVGYSGGKDSSACLQLMWNVLEKIQKENKPIKPLYVITTDTLVENPVVSLWVKTSLDLLRKKAQEKGLPIFPNLLTPNINETFWVNLIGKGYPAPNTKFRWCTERMKIRPSDRFLRKLSAESGEAILVIGTRKAESSNRLQSIAKFEKEATRENFQKHVNLANVSSFLPIKDWSNDDVWLYLLQEASPWGINNKDLLSMYQGATDGGECPLVVDTSTPSCGDSRFGCWVCTLVKEDKSMAAMVQNDSEKTWMEPLLQLRNNLNKKDHDKRDFRRITGNVQLMPNDDERSVPGPYLKKTREEWLQKLLEAQNKIKQNTKLPEEIKSLQLISQEELDEIRRIWFYEKLEVDDMVPKICEQYAKGLYKFETLEDNHVFDHEVLDILKKASKGDEMIFEIVRGLLETERKHLKSSKRVGLFDEFENIFKKSFYKDKTDAIEYAKLKKKIKTTREKELPLTGTE